MHSSKLCRSSCSSALPIRVVTHGWWPGRSESFLPSPSSSRLNRFGASSAAPPITGGCCGGRRGDNPWQPGALTRKMRSHFISALVPVPARTEVHSNGATAATAEPGEVTAGYQVPVKEIKEIVDAPPTPALSFSPKRDKILFLQRRSLPPLADLARPELKLAGLRIDASYNTRSRMSFYTAIKIHQILDEGTLGPERVVSGLPTDPKINYVSWSPDGAHLAFTVRGDEEEEGTITGLGLWVANIESGQAHKLIGPPNLILNPIFDTFSWVDESTLVVLIIPPSRGPPPKKPLVPRGPSIQSNELKEVVQNRTYQDLLKDQHDEDLFDYYAMAELVLLSLDGETKAIGPPAVYTSIDPSPDGEYILVSTTHRPYSFIVPSGRFPKKIELWKLNGEVVREICDLPLAENIPITFNSVRKGRRSVNWRSDKPSTLYWVETQDGGDAKVEVSPRDIVYTQSAKAHDGEEPQVLYKLDLRYGYSQNFSTVRPRLVEEEESERVTIRWRGGCNKHNRQRFSRERGIIQFILGYENDCPLGLSSCHLNMISEIIKRSGNLVIEGTEGVVIMKNIEVKATRGVVWGDESLALVYESWYKTRQTRTWAISPGHLEGEGRKLFDRSSEDVYSDPGSPMLRRTLLGTYVLAQINAAEGKKLLMLNGSGATPEGNIPFLDLFDMESGEKERIWRSVKEKYFETVVALMSDQKDEDLNLNELCILVSKESQTEPPQYYLRTWPDQKVSQITNFPHPYPQLANLTKEIIRYKRTDGVQLTANLYLPPGYDPVKEGPLPTLVWAYPREFKSKDNAGQMRGSRNSFAGIGSTSALLWLARRFAILDGPTMPIIGEGEEEANDRYVEQLVSSAQAAVDEVVKRGVANPRKIAVGGHSYGAFMTANLLAHAPHLFSCGIARAGAYNRTLTPFGFQAEERTLWEAPKTYIDMSPFMLADQIKKPILLIHGEEDNNPGTLTVQSERFYNALKGHGALTRLVLLPFESHGYQGRESVLHCLWEMDRWLQKHCIEGKVDESISVVNYSQSSEVQGAGSDTVAIGSRDGASETENFRERHNSWPWSGTLS